MMIKHHDSVEELPDDWWDEAGMRAFTKSSTAYRCDLAATNQRVCLIPITEIEPVSRAPGVPIFNPSSWEGMSAKDRVQRILKGFVQDVELPPVQLTKHTGQSPFRLKDGVHRLYCSIAAGFTDIPAVNFIDLETLDAGLELEELC
jgi:hypothetical protein